ncbi:MAG: SCO family protein [Marinifilaceae bacterium]
MKRLMYLCILIPLLWPFSSISQNNLNPAPDSEIGITEMLGDTVPGNIVLCNEKGEKVILKDLIDKPTALLFVYYRCPGICSPLMNGVAEVIGKSNLDLGNDYQVLTISFDPTESTELAVKKKNNYAGLVEGKNTKDGWLFFTTDSLNSALATQAFGFRYKKAGNEFLHAASMIIISPEGKITRYLNGTYFLPFEFKLALVEASKGQVGPTINKILQYCYSYDPVGQAYVLNITKVTGTIIILMAVIIFLLLSIKKVRRKTQA